jgi:transposase-like protein
VTLSDEVECDEDYVITGHKGQPEVVKSKGRQGRRRRLKGPCGRGTLEKERPPVFGMMQRGGQVVINLLANVKQKTIEPLIKDTIMPGTLVYTDEYRIYARLDVWGYDHKSVNHGRGEYARDEDGDGLCEVHVNTMEGFWSLLRSGVAELAAPPSGHFTRKTSALPRVLRVCAQCPKTRQSVASWAHCTTGHIRPWNPI